MSDKALIPLALHSFYKDEAEYRAELLKLVNMASDDDRNKAMMFETGLSSTEAAARKKAMKDNMSAMAKIIAARVGRNFAAVEALGHAIKPHIRRTMTPEQCMLWDKAGMSEQLFIEHMTAGISEMAKAVLNSPEAPEEVKVKARKALADLERLDKLGV